MADENFNWIETAIKILGGENSPAAEPEFDPEKYFKENTLDPGKLSPEDYVTVSHKDEETGEMRAYFVKLGELKKILVGGENQ